MNKAAKFSDPFVTLDGSARASVDLRALDTLWFNTGTLCNIECANCYIESSPTNDALVYLTTEEVRDYLDQIAAQKLTTREIGFTGGEPFMNPDIIPILTLCLERGFEVLVLTNAMQPMMRPRVQRGLLELLAAHSERLTLRISLDHHTALHHDDERGAGSFAKTLEGIGWLARHGFKLNVAGRSVWEEDEAVAKQGYADLFANLGVKIDVDDPAQLVIFPEMDSGRDVPEITTDCWSILNVDPAAMMCATSRMVVKHKGAGKPSVAACTLLPYDPQFDTGHDLKDALNPVRLNHRYCAEFCVLGGGSCT